MKGKEDMDREIVSACVNAVRKYCQGFKDPSSINEHLCVDYAMDTLKSEFRKRKGYRKYQTLRQDNFKELNDLYDRVWHEVQSKTRTIAIGFAARKMSLKVMAITSEAMLRSALAEKGCRDFQVECQKYRAKVFLSLPSGYKTYFYMKYRDIVEGSPKDTLDSFLEICRTIEELPLTVKIWK